MSLFSRYSRETFVYTSPKRDLARFIADVNRYCKEFEADCVLPTSEAGIMACSQYLNALDYAPMIPGTHDIDVAFSKANTLQVAASLGIPIPKTAHVSDLASVTLRTRDLTFPVVIKSVSSECVLNGRTQTSGKTVYAFSLDELARETEARLRSGQHVLLQEFIDGYGVGVSGLFDRGRPVALLAHRRLRESNPLGGPSALAETIELEPRLADATKSIMKEIAFTGPAMVEYRVDRRSGEPYVMEINGRFWGTVLLAPAAGLDLPYLYWKMVNGLEIQPVETRYRVGVRGRYLVGDTKCLLLCLKGRPKQWTGAFPQRWPALKAYMHSFIDRHSSDLILTPQDPMPFFARLAQDVI
jgi:predicted ATP-grasp superfamily ATP-dependent carboligase